MLMTYTYSKMNVFIPPISNDVYKQSERKRGSHKASCLDRNSSSITQDPLYNDHTVGYKKDEHNEDSANSQDQSSQDVEFKIILIGATGSGKSSTGNHFVSTLGNNTGFLTSCYAKSETKLSLSKTADKTVVLNQVKYKVNIIDTPAICKTELSVSEITQQLEIAKKMSLPGPHAFLLCIPANAIAKFYTDVADSYKQYFGKGFHDSTIVVFTRCDQFESENRCEFDGKRAMEQNYVLKNIKHHITLSKFLSNEDKNKKLEEVVGIIINMEKQKKSLISRFKRFVTKQ